VLFYLPITKTWLWQLILGLILICHSSYRGVVELLRDVFDLPISIGTIHNRLQAAAQKATAINLTQDLSGIKGLHDEIFQGSQPVLVGVDASSTYCYLLAVAEHRDEDIGVHLLDASKQGLKPDYTIADAATQSWASSSLAQTPCHGDLSHPASSQRISQLSVSTSGGSYFVRKTGAGNAQSETPVAVTRSQPN
jgi:hypothetical protein